MPRCPHNGEVRGCGCPDFGLYATNRRGLHGWATGGQANGLAVGADGRLYVSLSGNGVVTGMPAG